MLFAWIQTHLTNLATHLPLLSVCQRWHVNMPCQQDEPSLSLKGAVLVVGQSFSQPDAQLSQRLLQSGAPVVRDSWLSACTAAKARVPLQKHMVQLSPQQTSLPAVAGAVATAAGTSTPTTHQLQQLLEAMGQAGSSSGRGQKRDLQQLYVTDSSTHAPGRAVADVTGSLSSQHGPSSSSSQQPGGLLPPPKRQHRDSNPAVGRDGAVLLDLSAATAAAATASQQVSGNSDLSSNVANALRTYVSCRAWGLL